MAVFDLGMAGVKSDFSRRGACGAVEDSLRPTARELFGIIGLEVRGTSDRGRRLEHGGGLGTKAVVQ